MRSETKGHLNSRNPTFSDKAEGGVSILEQEAGSASRVHE